MKSTILIPIVLISIFCSCNTSNETVLYEELTPSGFREKLRQTPVAYLPLGTLEYHGEHLPLGTDALHSKGFFTSMAREYGGIVMPMIFLGPSWYTGQPIDTLIALHCTPSPKTGSCYWIPDSVYHMLLEQQFSLLAKTGFKVVVVHGHAPSIIYVEWHKKEWEEAFDMRIVPYFIYRDHGELGYSGHASVNETSLIMTYYPHLVKMHKISADTLIVPYGVDSKNPRGIASAKIGKDLEEKHMAILTDTLNNILNPAPLSQKLIQDPASYIESVESWQQERLEGLKSEEGWLNLAGIYWLKEGKQTFGSDSSNDIIFPAKAPAFMGSLTLKEESVHLEVHDEVELYFKGESVQTMDLSYERSGSPSYLTHGDFAWYIMKRHHSLAIRLRDYKNPAIEALDHIPSFPIDPDYVVAATLQPFDEPRTITVNTPFQDYTQDYTCPGELHFEIKDEKLKLLPFESGEGYFIVISDETSGFETYGGGRFMYTSPDSNGRILLDFNKAYNPPCAVTAFAACPMPPPENHLAIAIEAGEQSIH